MKKFLLVSMAVLVCTNLFAQNAFVYITHGENLRTEILLPDNTGFAIYTHKDGGFGYSEFFWAEKNGAFYLADENPVTDPATYLVVSKNGKAVIPALKFSIDGYWLTSEAAVNAGTMYTPVFADSSKKYPILGFTSSTLVAIENFSSANRKMTEIPYSLSNGILVFTLTGTEYRYFGVTGSTLVRIKGNDNLSPVYSKVER